MRSIALGLIGLCFFSACAAGSRASFALASATCGGTIGACELRCERDRDRPACDVATVMKAEEVASRGNKASVADVTGSLDAAGQLCRELELERACKAVTALQPRAAAQKAARLKADEVRAHLEIVAERWSKVTRARDGSAQRTSGRGPREDIASLRDALDAPDVDPAAAAERVATLEKAVVELEVAAAAAHAAEEARRQEEEAAAAVKARAAQAERDALAAKEAAWNRAQANCENALESCQKACATDPASDACQAQVIKVASGTISPNAHPNPGRARELARKGCSLGNHIGCKLQGKFEEDAKNCSDATECATYCDTGLGDACVNIGLMHLTGNGVPRSLSMGTVFFSRGCDRGSIDGCQKMAQAHMRGFGVARSKGATLTFLSKACKLGASVSCSDHAILCGTVPGCVPLPR